MFSVSRIYCFFLNLMQSAAIKVWLCSGWVPGGLSGFRLDETSEIKAAVSAQTRPTGGARGVRNYYMGLNMFSHWLSLAGHTGMSPYH